MHPSAPSRDDVESRGVKRDQPRKKWRAPQFMLSQALLLDTQNSASPIMTDGTPASQAT